MKRSFREHQALQIARYIRSYYGELFILSNLAHSTLMPDVPVMTMLRMCGGKRF